MQIVAGEEFAGAFGVLHRQFVDEIPNHVDFTGLSAQHLRVLVFDSQPERFDGGLSHFLHAGILYSPGNSASNIFPLRVTLYIPALKDGVFRDRLIKTSIEIKIKIR